MGKVNVSFILRYSDNYEVWLFNNDISATELVLYAKDKKVERTDKGKLKIILGADDVKCFIAT